MRTLLEDEISIAKAEALRDGFDKDTIERWLSAGRRLVAQLGFSGVAEVRRIADRFGR